MMLIKNYAYKITLVWCLIIKSVYGVESKQTVVENELTAKECCLLAHTIQQRVAALKAYGYSDEEVMATMMNELTTAHQGTAQWKMDERLKYALLGVGSVCAVYVGYKVIVWFIGEWRKEHAVLEARKEEDDARQRALDLQREALRNRVAEGDAPMIDDPTRLVERLLQSENTHEGRIRKMSDVMVQLQRYQELQAIHNHGRVLNQAQSAERARLEQLLQPYVVTGMKRALAAQIEMTREEIVRQVKPADQHAPAVGQPSAGGRQKRGVAVVRRGEEQ